MSFKKVNLFLQAPRQGNVIGILSRNILPGRLPQRFVE